MTLFIHILVKYWPSEFSEMKPAVLFVILTLCGAFMTPVL